MIYQCTACSSTYDHWRARCTCGDPAAAIIIQPPKMKLSRAPLSRFHIKTGIECVDHVLGDNSLSSGQSIVLAGTPGGGKSTLLAQMMSNIALQYRRRPLVYFSAEEPQSQMMERYRRLSLIRPYIVADNRLKKCIDFCHSIRPAVVVFDSLQRFVDEDLRGSAGTRSQIRSVAHHIIQLARDYHLASFAISQVNRADDIAGGRGIEHDFDTVLHLDSDDIGVLRLHTTKNRYGASHNQCYFKMTGNGLAEHVTFNDNDCGVSL